MSTNNRKLNFNVASKTVRY